MKERRVESLARVDGIIRQTVARSRQQLSLMASRFGLSAPQYAVLWVVARQGPITMSEIGEMTSLPASSLTGLADKLVARGMVTRETHPSDRRSILVQATDEGRAMAQRLEQARWESLQSSTAEFSNEDLQQLERLMGRMLVGIERDLERQTGGTLQSADREAAAVTSG